MKKFIIAFIPFLLFLQPAFADVFIQNDQPYIDDDGTLHIVGEIENNTNVPLNQIKITAKLLDGDGFQIGQISGETTTNVLMPGMNSGFDIIITGYDLHAITNYDLEFDYKITDPKNQAIEIISSELKNDGQGNLVISGMLENQGEITATVSYTHLTLPTNREV